jgi:hypothetical protein
MSSSDSEISPDDGYSSFPSVTLGTAWLGMPARWDIGWGPRILATFWGQNLEEGSWKKLWLAPSSQVSSFIRLDHFTQYFWPAPSPIMTPSTLAVAKASPKFSHFFFNGPNSSSVNRFNELPQWFRYHKMDTWGESAPSALPDAIDCARGIKTFQIDN